MEKVKNNLKEIIILILILLLVVGIFYVRHILYLRKKETLRPYSEQLTAQSTEEINTTKSTLWSRIKKWGKEKVNAGDSSNFVPKEEAGNTLIHFDVSSEYDSFIFDDTLLMYEGEQNGKRVKSVLDRMIETASDDFFSNPSVTIKNLSGSNGTITDDENYISNLMVIKNNINDADIYQISFGYNKLKTTANEVIIEKK